MATSMQPTLLQREGQRVALAVALAGHRPARADVRAGAARDGVRLGGCADARELLVEPRALQRDLPVREDRRERADLRVVRRVLQRAVRFDAARDAAALVQQRREQEAV